MGINKLIEFMKFCNEQTTNNDSVIAKVIIKHIDNIEDTSLESLSEEAHISTASISRFINKAGFKNFYEFKTHFKLTTQELKMQRIINHAEKYMSLSTQNMMDEIYDQAILNLVETFNCKNLELLKEIIINIKNSNTVTIIGDTHEIMSFYTFQLDLLANNIPSFLINIRDYKSIKYNELNENDSIIYLDMYERWYSEEKNYILNMKDKYHFKIVLFSQEDNFEDKCDYFYKYGVKDSNNNGYYSMFYLSQVLSEMVYHRV